MKHANTCVIYKILHGMALPPLSIGGCFVRIKSQEESQGGTALAHEGHLLRVDLHFQLKQRMNVMSHCRTCGNSLLVGPFSSEQQATKCVSTSWPTDSRLSMSVNTQPVCC